MQTKFISLKYILKAAPHCVIGILTVFLHQNRVWWYCFSSHHINNPPSLKKKKKPTKNFERVTRASYHRAWYPNFPNVQLRYVAQRCSQIIHARTHLAWHWQAGKPARAVTHSKNLEIRHGLALKPSMKEQLGHDIETRPGASRCVSTVTKLISEGWSIGRPAYPTLRFKKTFSCGLAGPSKNLFCKYRGMHLEVKCSEESPGCPQLL